MQKITPEKILPIVFYALLITGLGLIGYVGISRQAGGPSAAETNKPPSDLAQVIPLRLCKESTEKLCVLSTGYDAEGNLLISLKTTLRPIPTLYGVLRSQAMEIRFDCPIVNTAPHLLYCLGPFSGDVASADMELYEAQSGALFASGWLVASETALPLRLTPTPIERLTVPTQTPVSYPGVTPPAYPSYPSYPTYP